MKTRHWDDPIVDDMWQMVELMVIADVDDQMFKVTANGYLGEKL